MSLESFQQKLQSQPMAAGDVEKQVILFRSIIAQRDKFLNVKLQTQIGPVRWCARPSFLTFLSVPVLCAPAVSMGVSANEHGPALLCVQDS